MSTSSQEKGALKMAFVAWTHTSSRGELLARQLGASAHHIYDRSHPGKLQTPIRYLVQACRTWRVLSAERPDVVFVQNPPIFCVLLVATYCLWSGARYIIDSHSGAFLSPKWAWSLGLHRVLSRRALVTLVPNRDIEAIVGAWDCRVFALGFTPGHYPQGEQFPVSGGFNVAVISSFDPDEPLDQVFAAARSLPDVQFYVTGDARRLGGDVVASKPDNCNLTGYLPYERYIGLLRAVDTTIVLTTDDHTFLHGAYETVSLGKPLITSDWPVLRDYFSRGTVHVSNTAEGIAAGVRTAQRESASLQHDALLLRQQLYAEWDRKLSQLRQLLAA